MRAARPDATHARICIARRSARAVMPGLRVPPHTVRSMADASFLHNAVPANSAAAASGFDGQYMCM